MVTVTLQPFANYVGRTISVVVLVALLVYLIPTTIGGLLSAIGIAGMDRLVQRNVLAMSGRAVEAAGDIDTLLLDKTGTITFGNRLAAEFIPVDGATPSELVDGRACAPRSPTRRRRAVGRRPRPQRRASARRRGSTARRAPSSSPSRAETRLSGIRLNGSRHMQGRRRRGRRRLAAGRRRRTSRRQSTRIAGEGGTPLAVIDGRRGARPDLPQGHGEARHARSASTSCGGWASAPSWSPATTR